MKNPLRVFVLVLSIASAAGSAGAVELQLENGWVNAPAATSNAEVFFDQSGIVRFKGAISGGASDVAFTLPLLMRPQLDAYVPVDLCNGVKGRLRVQPNGDVSVESSTIFGDAQCFTSLDGASLPEPGELPALLSGVLLLVWLRGYQIRTRSAGGR